MNSRRLLVNSRSFAQNSMSFQGKKAHFRIQGVFQDKTQIQGVFMACANHIYCKLFNDGVNNCKMVEISAGNLLTKYRRLLLKHWSCDLDW